MPFALGQSFPYSSVGSTGGSGAASNRVDLGTAARAAGVVLGGTAGSVSIAQLTKGTRLSAGTHLLQVTSLDEQGHAVSRKQVKFWVVR